MSTPDEVLHDWMRQRLRLFISRKQICENHVPPFQFFADSFYERASQTIGLSCRTGGKTIGVAGLNVAEMSRKPNCGIVSLAGNFAQAQRGYRYVVEMLKRDRGLASMLAGVPLQKRTELINGANLEILTASERSVHSPHVPKLRIDEVDLVTEEIYQGALSIPISLPNVKATVVMTSTRFKAYGMMFNLVEEAPSKGIPVYTWCVKEVLERCPYRYDRCPMKKCEGFCDGKWCKTTQGYLKVDDIYAKFMQMDEETWRTQWMVEKPSRFGLVYDQFGTEHIVTELDLPPFLRLEQFKDEFGNIRQDPTITPAWNQVWDWASGVDFGYEDPSVVLLIARLPNDDIYVLDELYMQHAAPSQFADAAVRKFPMLVARPYDTNWDQYQVAPTYVDPSDPGAAYELQMRNFLCVSRKYNLQEGISLTRRWMKPPGNEKPKLYVHERCRKLRAELNRYHLKEDTNSGGRARGTLDVPERGDDHGPDALRYFINGTFMPEQITVEQGMMWSPPKVPISPDLDVFIPGQIYD